jgi:hypothetical protein
MATINTEALDGTALNWAVGEASGGEKDAPYCTSWAHGGSIVERDKIELIPERTDEGLWCAAMLVGDRDLSAVGPTPLVAAMRCYVRAKSGLKVKVPDDLLAGKRSMRASP